jgi:hypothetical protein
MNAANGGRVVRWRRMAIGQMVLPYRQRMKVTGATTYEYAR